MYGERSVKEIDLFLAKTISDSLKNIDIVLAYIVKLRGIFFARFIQKLVKKIVNKI